MKTALLLTSAIAVVLVAFVRFNARPQQAAHTHSSATHIASPPAPVARNADLASNAEKANTSDPIAVDAPAPATKKLTKSAFPANDDDERRMLADPESRKRLHGMMRRDEARARPDLRQALALSEAEYNRLLDLLADQSLAGREMALAESAANGGKPPTWDVKRLDALQERRRRELVEVFGEDLAKAFDSYEEASDARAYVGQFLAPLLKGDLALSDQQTAHLIAGLHETNRQFQQELQARYRGRDISTSGWMSMGATFITSPSLGRSDAAQVDEQVHEYQERVLRVASSALSSDQFEVFDKAVRQHLIAAKPDLLLSGVSNEEN